MTAIFLTFFFEKLHQASASATSTWRVDTSSTLDGVMTGVDVDKKPHHALSTLSLLKEVGSYHKETVNQRQ